MQNVKQKKNLAMLAVSLQGTESSFDFVLFLYQILSGMQNVKQTKNPARSAV